ncbi:hypothetical protein CTAYLR_009810 [Chrysophaeum taylorii]|uniref:Protein kinase domain-containing protein n=1 Tax=Chrysophaeum taylorii TaxID=2483200 RepID=A0AAD7XF44_9STRA|nr:hypothetical protein CTAYLR_009810 [Chrysophaeum taylorii]
MDDYEKCAASNKPDWPDSLHMGTMVGRYLGLLRESAVSVVVDKEKVASPSGYTIYVDLGDSGARLARPVTPEQQATPEQKPSPSLVLSKQPLRPSDLDAIRRIGRGAFGTVFLARVKGGGGALFAVKVLKKRQLLKTKSSTAVLRERAVARDVHHRFVVTLRCAFQSLESLYLCTDFYVGGSLGDSLKRRRRTPGKIPFFPLVSVRFYAAELACAIRYLHSKGVVHRDVKPANVLIDQHGHIALSDFGISTVIAAKRASSSYWGPQPFASSGFNGTVAYMAPELLRSHSHLTTAVDWWAYGCSVYELAHGTDTPFAAPSPRILFSNILNSQPVFPNKKIQRGNEKEEGEDPPLADPHIQGILKALLHKYPNKRATPKTIFSAPFFGSIDWVLAERGDLDPPEGCPPLPAFLHQDKQGHLYVPTPKPQADDDLKSVQRRVNFDIPDDDATFNDRIQSFRSFAWTGNTNLAASPTTYKRTSESPSSSLT